MPRADQAAVLINAASRQVSAEVPARAIDAKYRPLAFPTA